MYNILFGRNEVAPLILATLGLTTANVARFRDAFISEGKIAVYTRLGGGNRECYCENGDKHDCYQAKIAFLQGHPNYLSDEDDDFDETYATFYFSIPPKWQELLAPLESGKFDPDARFAQKLQELKEMDADTLRQKYPELCKVVDQLLTRKNAK